MHDVELYMVLICVYIDTYVHDSTAAVVNVIFRIVQVTLVLQMS